MSLGNQTVKAKRNLNHSLQCSVIRCEIQGKGNAVFLSAIAMVGNRMFKLRNGRGRQYLGQKQPGRLLHPADLLADQGALEAGFRHGQLGIGEIAVAQLFPGPVL